VVNVPIVAVHRSNVLLHSMGVLVATIQGQ